MSFSSEKKVFMKMSKEFTVEPADQFRAEAKALMEKGTYNFVLDFSDCQFIDSTGLGVLVSVYKKSVENNGQVILKSLNHNVLKVFKLTRLDQVFTIE